MENCNQEFCKGQTSFVVTSNDGDAKKVCSNHLPWAIRMLAMPGETVSVTMEVKKNALATNGA